MNAERWRRVGELFHQLVELDAEERRRCVAEVSGDDPSLAAELEQLLAFDRETGPGALAVQPHPQSDRDGELGAEILPGARVGPWEIGSEIARGGMGIVYRARRADGAFEREVAVKVIRPDRANAALGARFVEERRLLGGLDHPGIARLLDAGESEGRLYLVLDLVEGPTLDGWARGRPLSDRLRLFLAVCEAVEHAHRRLVLHRDIKPANIRVDEQDRPKLLDFGIARLIGVDEHSAMTRQGLRALTPEFASPEQLRGEALTTASDVYSLGVVLFELLTDERPYRLAPTTSPEERARRICLEGAPLASAVLRRRHEGGPSSRPVRGDLDAIGLRALEPDPDLRYATATELADDLRRHLAGHPIHARMPSLLERCAKFVRRNRGPVAAAAATALALLIATGVSLDQAARARAERSRAEATVADLRRLANVLLFDVHDSIAPLAGATSARKLLVQTGVAYLAALERDAARDPVATRDLARAYTRLATLQRATTAASLGETANAMKSFERAIALWQALAESGALDGHGRFEYAITLRHQAEALFTSGQASAAARSAGTAAQLLASPTVLAPADQDLTLTRGVARAELGYFTAHAGNLEDGLAIALSGLEALQSLDSTREVEALEPDTAESRGSLPALEALELAAARVADIQSNLPDGFEAAIQFRARALDIARQRARLAPEDARVERTIAGHLAMLGSFYEGVGDLVGADASLSEALARMTAFVARDPVDQTAARVLENIRIRASFVACSRGGLDRAEQLATAALHAVQGQRELDPADLSLRFLEANAQRSLGVTCRARATASEADVLKASWLERSRTSFAAARAILAQLRDSGAITGSEAALVDELDQQLREVTVELQRAKVAHRLTASPPSAA